MATGRLTGFYPGTTKQFAIKISRSGSVVDISGDIVIFTLKQRRSDPDSDALIRKHADVATSGATGLAIFELTPGETDIAPRQYYYDVFWRLPDGSEFVILSGAINVLERVSDVGGLP